MSTSSCCAVSVVEWHSDENRAFVMSSTVVVLSPQTIKGMTLVNVKPLTEISPRASYYTFFYCQHFFSANTDLAVLEF